MGVCHLRCILGTESLWSGRAIYTSNWWTIFYPSLFILCVCVCVWTGHSLPLSLPTRLFELASKPQDSSFLSTSHSWDYRLFLGQKLGSSCLYNVHFTKKAVSSVMVFVIIKAAGSRLCILLVLLCQMSGVNSFPGGLGQALGSNWAPLRLCLLSGEHCFCQPTVHQSPPPWPSYLTLIQHQPFK